MLAAIKKQFRNPISHGGFDNQGTLFHFHVPGLSALPALLTRHNVSIERYATPISRAEFERLCGQLDECDGLLEQSAIGPASVMRGCACRFRSRRISATGAVSPPSQTRRSKLSSNSGSRPWTGI